jgi:hypothetical protein
MKAAPGGRAAPVVGTPGCTISIRAWPAPSAETVSVGGLARISAGAPSGSTAR